MGIFSNGLIVLFTIGVAILFAIFIVWLLVMFIKSKPESLSGVSLNKSFFTMGTLALMLIVFIGLVAAIL